MKETKEEQVIGLIAREFIRATQLNGPFNSAHEGWAVILEELDELWEEVRKKSSDRDLSKMEKEAIQVAAMGMRFVIDVCRKDQNRPLPPNRANPARKPA